MVKRRRRRRFKPSQIFLGLLGLLGWLVPAIIFIVYAIFVRGFIPADTFLRTSIYVSSVVAAALTIALLPKLWADLKESYAQRDIRAMAKAALIAVAMPPFVFFPFHVLLSQVVPYALHLGSNPQKETHVELVTGVSYGGKTCRRPAALKGDRILLHRRVCGLLPEHNRLLEHGGTIELRGFASPYGFQVEQYRVISTHG